MMKPLDDLPVYYAHKGPIIITGRAGVKLATGGDVADDIVRADKIDTQIAAASMLDVHGQSYVLKDLQVGFLQHICSNLKGNNQALVALGNGFVDMHPRREVPGLWFYIL